MCGEAKLSYSISCSLMELSDIYLQVVICIFQASLDGVIRIHMRLYVVRRDQTSIVVQLQPSAPPSFIVTPQQVNVNTSFIISVCL